MNRRQFLGRVGTAAVVAVAAPVIGIAAPRVADKLRLWGDGFHDDTDAIQALIDRAAQTGWTVTLPAGTYAVSRTIEVDRRAGFVMRRSRLVSSAEPALRFASRNEGDPYCEITNSVFEHGSVAFTGRITRDAE